MAFSQQVQHLVGNIHVVGGLGRGRIRLSPHLPGVLADPVQSRLGIHRRRLMRLIDTLEVEMRWQQTPSPREHFFLRSAFDLWDAGVFHYDYRGALISLWFVQQWQTNLRSHEHESSGTPGLPPFDRASARRSVAGLFCRSF
jgi:hypothetical protein